MYLDIDASELEIDDEIMIPVKVFNVRREGSRIVIYIVKPPDLQHAFEREKMIVPASKTLLIKAKRRYR